MHGCAPYSVRICIGTQTFDLLLDLLQAVRFFPSVALARAGVVKPTQFELSIHQDIS